LHALMFNFWILPEEPISPLLFSKISASPINLAYLGVFLLDHTGRPKSYQANYSFWQCQVLPTILPAVMFYFWIVLEESRLIMSYLFLSKTSDSFNSLAYLGILLLD
jgi:hypothetical protein